MPVTAASCKATSLWYLAISWASPSVQLAAFQQVDSTAEPMAVQQAEPTLEAVAVAQRTSGWHRLDSSNASSSPREVEAKVEAIPTQMEVSEAAN
jgi:hypothetical protein